LGGGWEQNLINSVEGGVAGVKLDGGEDGLSGCAGGGDSVVGEGSRGNGGSGSSISQGKTGCGITGVGSRGSDELSATALPLSTGSGLSSGMSSGMLGLSGNNFRGIYDRGGTDSGVDGGNKGSDGGGNRGGRKVGTRHLETVDGVSDIVDSLEDAISVNLLIRSSDNTISVARLSSGRWATSITESELSKLVLSMELMSLLMDWSCKGPGGDSEQLSAGGAHASCQYNLDR